MPARDPEKRRETMAAYRERISTPAYMSWLVARRKLRTEAGEFLRAAIDAALLAENGYAATLILRAALDDLGERERALGNRYDHELDKPFWDEDWRPGPLKDPAAVALGRRGGRKGGPARASKMTAEERSESARKAAQARWAK